MAGDNSIQRLLEAGDVAALEEIARTAPKAEAKEAKRALHRLASRGVKIPEAPPPGEKVFRPARDDFGTECLLTAFDAHGGRAAFIFVRNPAGGVRGTVVFLDEENGIVEAQELEMGRRQYREWVDGLLKGRGKTAAHRADPDEVRRALRDGRARTEEAKRVLPEAAAALPAEWYAPVAERPEPEADLSLAADSDTLFAEPEIARWFPPKDFLDLLVHRLQEVETSQVLIGEEQKVQRIDELICAATDEFFTEGRRRSYAHRLRGTAVMFEAAGRAGPAAVARAAAAWLDDAGANIGGCGFAHRFIGRLFATPEGRQDDGPPEESRLIVTPDEFAREMAKKPDR